MPSHNEQVLRSLEEAWNTRDIAALTSLFTEDCRYDDLALGASHHGRDGVREFAEGVYVTMPDFHLDFTDIDAGPDFGATAWTITATWSGEFEGHDRTGERAEFSGISRYKFADGLIRLNVDCWDSVQLIRRFRVLPSDLAQLVEG